MKTAPKIILFVNDADGFAAALTAALRPNPNSNIQTKEESFELSLERYGIKDLKASGKIFHFFKSDDSYEVSIMLMENYEPPLLACALNEVLASLIRDNASTIPTIVVPFMLTESKLKMDKKDSSALAEVSVYGFRLGPKTGLTDSLCSKLRKPPPSLQINHECLNCALQLLRVLPLPSLVLIGVTDQYKSQKTSDEELQVMYDIGEILASFSSFGFVREKVVWSPSKSTIDRKEPWRELYGIKKTYIIKKGDHFININFWFNVDQSRLIVSIMDNMKGAGTSSSSKVQFPLHIGIGTLPHMMSKVQPQIMRRPKSNKSQMWWPDNHVSFKNSKWIQENLEEMDHKVKQMLKLIEEEPDSSTKKKPGKHSPKSPELIHLVDEFSRMYRLLAERYDHVNAEGPGGNTPDESSYIEYSESESDESSVVNSSAVVHPNVDEIKILAMEEEMKSTKEKLLDSENEVGRLNQELKKIQESEQASRSQLERVMDQALESKGKLDKSAYEVSDRDQEIRQLKEEIINSERSLSDVKTYHHEEIFKLEKERSYLEKKVNEVNVWCQSLEEDVRQVQTEKSVLEASLRAEIEQLQTNS
ncbi:hypothetical protein Leryth_004425 [Lithospermum erythrorhizon]|nr:hypothetical protein Leryth_004425 [Lithospermum erythrorhizon]